MTHAREGDRIQRQRVAYTMPEVDRVTVQSEPPACSRIVEDVEKGTAARGPFVGRALQQGGGGRECQRLSSASNDAAPQEDTVVNEPFSSAELMSDDAKLKLTDSVAMPPPAPPFCTLEIRMSWQLDLVELQRLLAGLPHDEGRAADVLTLAALLEQLGRRRVEELGDRQIGHLRPSCGRRLARRLVALLPSEIPHEKLRHSIHFSYLMSTDSPSMPSSFRNMSTAMSPPQSAMLTMNSTRSCAPGALTGRCT